MGKLKCSAREPAGERRASACRRARDLRDHGRPRARHDVPLAVPARGARPPRLPDRRRRLRRLVARAARRACSRIDRRDGREDRRGGLRAAREAPVLCPRRLHRRRRRTRRSRRRSEMRELPVFYLEIPPSLFGTVVGGLSNAGLTENARVVVEKPFGHDLASARALNAELHALHRRVPALPHRPLPREDVRRGHPLPPLREHDPRAGLEPAVRLLRADHDGRGLRRRRPRALLRPGRCDARRRPEPSPAGPEPRRDGAAHGPRHGHHQQPQARRLRRDGRGRPVAVRARPVPAATSTSTASRRTRRRRPSARCGSRSTTGAGPASRSSSAPGKSLPVTVTEVRVVFNTTPWLGFVPKDAPRPEPNQLVLRIGPQARARACACRRRTPKRRRFARSSSTWSSRVWAVRGQRPTRCCSRRRCAVMRASFARQDAVEETWRVVQPLSTRRLRSRSTSPAPGGRRRRTSSPVTTEAGGIRGCREGDVTTSARRRPRPRRPLHHDDPDALHRRDPGGELGTSGDADRHRARHVHALAALPPLRSGRPDLAEPRPLRAVGGSRLRAALVAAASHRRACRRPRVRDPRRAGRPARRPEALPAARLEVPGPSRVPLDERRRDDLRPARPGRRDLGRHGGREPVARRALQPRRLHALRLRRVRAGGRRLHDGGRRVGGGLLRRAPAPLEPLLDLRLEPRHDRGPHGPHVHGGRRRAVHRVRLERGRRSPTRTTSRRPSARSTPSRPRTSGRR